MICTSNLGQEVDQIQGEIRIFRDFDGTLSAFYPQSTPNCFDETTPLLIPNRGMWNVDAMGYKTNTCFLSFLLVRIWINRFRRLRSVHMSVPQYSAVTLVYDKGRKLEASLSLELSCIRKNFSWLRYLWLAFSEELPNFG